MRSLRSASPRVDAETRAVPAIFISVAIPCIWASDNPSASRTAAAGLPAKGRSVKTSTLMIGTGALISTFESRLFTIAHPAPLGNPADPESTQYRMARTDRTEVARRGVSVVEGARKDIHENKLVAPTGFEPVFQP